MVANPRRELHELVDQLSDETAAAVLEYARWLQDEDDTLGEEELATVQRGEEQIEAGKYVTLEELRRSVA